MIYRKEMNERSPLRVFERSIHGGLGRGNIGVVLARAGVGKTAFLVGVALDELLREGRVLHVAHGDSVDHVRSYYDEIFLDLARTTRLEDVAEARITMERNRMIHCYPKGALDLDKFTGALDFLRDHVGFAPDLVILDGVDLARLEETAMVRLKKLAGEREFELWLPVQTHREDRITHPGGLPETVARFVSWISVAVALQPGEGAVHVRLLKDHDNPDVPDLEMRLDPATLLLLAER